MTYRETYRRHRRLLKMPIIVTTVLALWIVAGSPKAYESTASLWVDTPPPGPSSINDTNTTVRTPADQQQLVLTELLHTRDFKLTVGHRGPLAAYLAKNASAGWGPSALLASVRGTPSLEARVADALGPKNVIATVAGPQVLQLSVRGASPRVDAGTLQALIQTFSSEVQRLAAQRGQATIGFYQSQLDAAAAALRAAAPGSPGARIAANQLARATRGRDRAVSSAAVGAHISVIDAPRVPAGPLAGNKKLVLALFGGLFAGALLTLLGLVLLTPSRPGAWDDPQAAGLHTVPARPLARRAKPKPRATAR
ncbi:MAG: hypothetical protein ACXVHX_32920 [Solirubrobacteraceae bacterium]